MILDKLLMFSEAQAVTATAASTDVIDLGPIKGTKRDIGVGEPIEFWAMVNTTATAAGAATLNVQLQTSTDNATWVTLFDSGSLALASLVAGKRILSTKVPQGVLKYLRVNYVVGTGPLTAGAFTAGMNLDVDANTHYATAFTVK
ncbi:Bbp16 family capsid cement protein [Yersinia enterocolitica]|uniref:Bbp16 family capsid cement protein n=1 Tax=Yersinia enterocolitica TaxID=630 RepID=UPI00398CF6DE